jgi:RNA polymerase sigma factor (sigma-70 family)
MPRLQNEKSTFCTGNRATTENFSPYFFAAHQNLMKILCIFIPHSLGSGNYMHNYGIRLNLPKLTPHRITEYEMIKGCINKNAACQRMLFDTFAGKMMTVCLRYAHDTMEAEDMLQDGFIRVFNNIHQFKFEGSFEGWVRRVMVNCALKHLQKRKINFTDIEEHTAHLPSTESYAPASLGEEELLKLINRLPTGYKIVFNLNVIEGYTHEEIAEMMNIQASTSRSQLVKARKMLQSQIMQLQKIAV